VGGRDAAAATETVVFELLGLKDTDAFRDPGKLLK